VLGLSEGADKRVPCVDINNRIMAARAVNHLIETGRKNILMLVPEKLQHICCIQDRINGYHDALKENEIKESAEFIRIVRSLEENVTTFFSDLRCLDEIDAIFCPTDELAALCIPTLKAIGKKIPEDIAIMGFDDQPIARHTSPPLSTVRRPANKHAHAAIDLLLKILKKEIPYESGFHEIETDLVIRGSTTPR
jgi:DNA-binding LacI/PurR family transcriptional regulator